MIQNDLVRSQLKAKESIVGTTLSIFFKLGNFDFMTFFLFEVF